MESTDARTLKFGSFELDVQLRELRTPSTRVRLQEQPDLDAVGQLERAEQQYEQPELACADRLREQRLLESCDRRLLAL